MRDFRDAKTMAHTLRAALAADLGIKITNSQSLELIAEAFGAADWNTLAAAIRAEAADPRQKASPPPPLAADVVTEPRFSAELEATLHRAFAFANQRKHEYTTLEHLLIALIDDDDASAVMKACDVDLVVLRDALTDYVDSELKKLQTGDGSSSRPTAGFQRVAERAKLQVERLGGETVTGVQVLLAIFTERESTAVWLLREQDMTRDDAANFIASGIGKRTGGAR
jgi:Clp amino terminal domain, pathogenicity island component/Glyoxalase superfamily protein